LIITKNTFKAYSVAFGFFYHFLQTKGLSFSSDYWIYFVSSCLWSPLLSLAERDCHWYWLHGQDAKGSP